MFRFIAQKYNMFKIQILNVKQHIKEQFEKKRRKQSTNKKNKT